MKLNLFITLLTTTALVSAIDLNITVPKVQAETATKFICATSYNPETHKRHPTTFAWTPRGKIAVILWLKYFPQYSSQQRCNIVSSRFHRAYHNDTLGLITNGTMNNQPVICTTREAGGVCDTLLMTLRPNENSLKILNDLRKIFNGGPQVGPVKHNAGTPQVYYQIDIEEFLRTAPVEK